MYIKPSARSKLLGNVRSQGYGTGAKEYMYSHMGNLLPSQSTSVMAAGNMNPAGIKFNNPMTNFGLGDPFTKPQNYGLQQVPGLVPPFNPMPR